MKRIYIRIYSYSSLQDEIDVTHLSLNKIVPLMSHNDYEFTRVTLILTDDEVLFHYNSKFDTTTIIQELVDAYYK